MIQKHHYTEAIDHFKNDQKIHQYCTSHGQDAPNGSYEDLEPIDLLRDKILLPCLFFKEQKLNRHGGYLN